MTPDAAERRPVDVFPIREVDKRQLPVDHRLLEVPPFSFISFIYPLHGFEDFYSMAWLLLDLILGDPVTPWERLKS